MELDGEAVILDEARTRLHHLNPSATVVWACCDGSATVAELARDVAAEFGTDPDAARVEVLALARELGAAGLLAGVDADTDVEVDDASDAASAVEADPSA